MWIVLWSIAVFFAVDLYTQELVFAFVRLTTLLVLYRVVSHRTRREDLQLAYAIDLLTGLTLVSAER